MASNSSLHALSRRQFLKVGALMAGTGALAACAAPAAAPAATQGGQAAAPAAAATSVVVWYQDWDGGNRLMKGAKAQWAKSNPNATIELTPIPFADLLAKLLPSIASGTEGDVLMMYTDWVVGTDVSKVFLELTDIGGGAKAMREAMWPAAFGILDVPGDKVFYLPWLAGIRGAATSVNQEQLAEKKIDYLNFKTFEEMVEAGKTLTQKTGDKITHAGYSPRNSQYQLLWSFIWQMGGNFFDRESGKWSHSTDIGEQAAQLIYDLYWKDQVCDFDLFTTEGTAVSQKLVSMWSDGAWTASFQTDSSKVPSDNIVTPFLANAKEKVLYPQHIGSWGLSKRLADKKDKLASALGFAQFIVSPDALIQAFDSYSGVCMTKAVYTDPRIEKMKYGPMSKRIAEGMWPVAKYPGDHVANQAPASTELDRAMRKEITIKEALANMDKYLQDQEDQARERIKKS